MPDEVPTQPPPPSPEPGTAAKSTSTGLPSNVAAAIACIPLIGGIIFYILEKHDPFVRFYAMQSIIFGCAWFLFNIVSAVVHAVFGAIPGIGGILVFFLGNRCGAGSSRVPGRYDHYHRKGVHRRPLGYPVHRSGCAETG
jgi:Predicted membrane protein